MARNRINSIQPTIANYVPNLKTLVLTSNNFAELADLDTLKLLPKLTHLSLLDNAVTRKEVCVFFLFGVFTANPCPRADRFDRLLIYIVDIHSTIGSG